MIKKILIFLLVIFIMMNAASAIDSSNWSEAEVGYETFKIPPEYENPYSSDFDMYEYDYDIDVFTIRYVNPNIMSLYGYYINQYHEKKVEVEGHDAVHFTYYDRANETNNSILWFSAGEEFYYITWTDHEITPVIKEVVKSSSESKYSHEEFYDILDEEFKQYELVHAIESQGYDSVSSSSGHHSFVSVGSNGINFGVMN